MSKILFWISDQVMRFSLFIRRFAKSVAQDESTIDECYHKLFGGETKK